MNTVPRTEVKTFYNGEDAEYEWTAYYWDDVPIWTGGSY